MIDCDVYDIQTRFQCLRPLSVVENMQSPIADSMVSIRIWTTSVCHTCLELNLSCHLHYMAY
jgi:hypothetical protein